MTNLHTIVFQKKLPEFKTCLNKEIAFQFSIPLKYIPNRNTFVSIAFLEKS